MFLSIVGGDNVVTLLWGCVSMWGMSGRNMWYHLRKISYLFKALHYYNVLANNCGITTPNNSSKYSNLLYLLLSIIREINQINIQNHISESQLDLPSLLCHCSVICVYMYVTTAWVCGGPCGYPNPSGQLYDTALQSTVTLESGQWTV